LQVCHISYRIVALPEHLIYQSEGSYPAVPEIRLLICILAGV